MTTIKDRDPVHPMEGAHGFGTVIFLVSVPAVILSIALVYGLAKALP